MCPYSSICVSYLATDGARTNFRYQMIVLITWDFWLSPCTAHRNCGLAAFGLLLLGVPVVEVADSPRNHRMSWAGRDPQTPWPWKWQVLGIQMLFSGQYNSQFCHLLAEYAWLACRCQLTAFVIQCIHEKGTEIMTLLATLPPELQPLPSLNQVLFFKSRKWNKMLSLCVCVWREKKKTHWP